MRKSIALTIVVAVLVSRPASAQAPLRPSNDHLVIDHFTELHTKQSLAISPDVVSGTRITFITVAADGAIVLADAKESNLIYFDARGANRRVISRHGSGPGAISRLSGIGWLGAQLAVLDGGLRRVQLLNLADGANAGTLSYGGAAARPQVLLNAGPSLYAVTERRSGAKVSSLPGAYPVAPAEFDIATVDSTGIGLPIKGLADSTVARDGMDCEDRAGKVIYIIDSVPMADRGSLRAVSMHGELISASRDSFFLTVRAPGGMRRDIRAAVAAMPMTNRLWDSVAREYITLSAAHGQLDCDPTMIRPRTFPVIRALSTDEAGTIWVEVSTVRGEMIYGMTLQGEARGMFALPRNTDPKVPWVVHGGRFYAVTNDADDAQGVIVVDIGK